MAAISGLFFFYICSMVSITRVFDIVRDLANKDQLGFVGIQEFNSFCQAAQSKVYNEIWDEYLLGKKLRKQGADGSGAKSLLQTQDQDLSHYLIEVELVAAAAGTDFFGTFGAGDTDLYTAFFKPDDFKQLVGLQVGRNPQDSNTCEVTRDFNHFKLAHRSRLSAPAPEFPLALDKHDTFRISPAPEGGDTPDIVFCLYYRQPRSLFAQTFTNEAGEVVYVQGDLDRGSLPQINGTEVGQVFVPNLAATRNFDLPDHYLSEVVKEVATMVGVSLRDNILAQYGLKETAVE